jgi:putative transposase
MKTQYHKKSHSKHLIKLHFVIAVKYRKSILVGKLSDDIQQIIHECCTEKSIVIDAMESDKDHLHILVDIPPTLSAFDVIHRIKQITTFKIYKTYRQFLKQYFWKENTFWSDGYFVCSTGNANMETIKKYINQQG